MVLHFPTIFLLRLIKLINSLLISDNTTTPTVLLTFEVITFGGLQHFSVLDFIVYLLRTQTVRQLFWATNKVYFHDKVFPNRLFLPEEN